MTMSTAALFPIWSDEPLAKVGIIIWNYWLFLVWYDVNQRIWRSTSSTSLFSVIFSKEIKIRKMAFSKMVFWQIWYYSWIKIRMHSWILTMDLVRSGRLAIGGGMPLPLMLPPLLSPPSSSLSCSPLAELWCDERGPKLYACECELERCTWPTPPGPCDSESVGVLLGLLLLTRLSEEPMDEARVEH